MTKSPRLLVLAALVGVAACGSDRRRPMDTDAGNVGEGGVRDPGPGGGTGGTGTVVPEAGSGVTDAGLDTGTDASPPDANALEEDGGVTDSGSVIDAGCADADSDTVCDTADLCPGSDDRVDADGDAVPDACDNCASVANTDQAICAADTGDSLGDACDGDDDGDLSLDADDSNDCDPNTCSDDDADGCNDCTSGTHNPATDGSECGDERGGADGLCDGGDDDDDNDGCPDTTDTNDCNDSVCGDCATPSDGDGCDDCNSGSGAPNSVTDGLDCDGDGQCGVAGGGADTDDDGDGVLDQAAGGADTADADPASCSDVDGDSCNDCSVVNLGVTCLTGTAVAGDATNDGTDSDGGGSCDLGDNCDATTPETQTDGDGDGYGDVCDTCSGGDDDVDADTDSVADFCDNCPSVQNMAQADSDPSCGAGGEPAEGAGRAELGDACDNCDFVCNDQTNTYGIRATPLLFPTTITAADCVDGTFYSSETDDLALGDDEVSRCFDLDDENADGVVSGGETGDFSFMFFGRAIDAIRISNNGYMYLYESMSACGAAGNGAGETNGFTDPQPDAGAIPVFDGADDVIAAGWTNLAASTQNPTGTTDPCVSLQVIGTNSSSSQILEVTWEYMRLKNDTDMDEPVTMQIRLHEGQNRIEVTSAPFSSNLEAGQTDQLATRGVEGLFNDGSTDLVAGAYVGAETFATGDDEMRSVLQLTNNGIELTTALTTVAETSTGETGDACDNLVLLPRCGDGFCHKGGGETSAPVPPTPDVGEPAVVVCLADCSCGDGICDFGENEESGSNTCGFCHEDCNPGTVPDRDGCCGDAICDTDEGEDEDVSGFCGTCPGDCTTLADPCCGDLSCGVGETCANCPFDGCDPAPCN